LSSEAQAESGRPSRHSCSSNGGSALLVGRREAKTREAVQELGSCGEVSGWSVDITSNAGRATLIDHLLAKARGRYLACECRRCFRSQAVSRSYRPDYDRYLEINRALFFITQCVAKNMVAGKRGGSIVNIGSMWARQAVQATPSSAYSMAKAGLHALTQHLALELATAGIRVNAVSPAVVNNANFRRFPPKNRVPSFFTVFNAFHPHRPYRRPEDVAEIVATLLSGNPPGSRARFGMSMEAFMRERNQYVS